MAHDNNSDLAEVRRYLAAKTKQRDIALLMGLSRSRIANMARVLKQARPEWIEWVESRLLKLKHLEYVIRLRPDDADALLRKAMALGWSTETVRREARKGRGHRDLSEHSQDPNVASYEKQLADHFGTRVAIVSKPGHKDGTLVFYYSDNDALEGLLEKMGYQAG